MKKALILLLLMSLPLHAQNYFPSKKLITSGSGFTSNSITEMYAIETFGGRVVKLPEIPPVVSAVRDSGNVRWIFNEPAAIAQTGAVSGNGRYIVAGWMLNNHRVSLFKSDSPVPVWEFQTGQGNYTNYTDISDTGGVVAVGTNLNIYLFSNNSPVPFFNYDLTQLEDTGIATALAVTGNGSFLVASVSRNDSSTIFGFSAGSNSPVWKRRIRPTVTTGGGSIQGVKMSANDSLLIVNTYAEFFVINTFTGQVIFSGLINPSSPSSGSQSAQGISGNGNVIATINYSGILRVYQRSGSTYNFLWQNQEPPGQFFNWYTAVDITDDGENIAAGTLNFITSSSYDGKVKAFKRAGNGTPVWTYAGCGDEVNMIDFSSSGNILSAASWGEFSGTTDDLYIFKTLSGNLPVFSVGTPGSLFCVSTSNDGRTVAAGGKAVHARQFGSGGLLYCVDVDTSQSPTSVTSTGAVNAEGYALYQNYPNPFNPETRIQFSLPPSVSLNSVSLKLYDITGREVVDILSMSNLARSADGSIAVRLSSDNLASGVYYYSLISESVRLSRALMIVR